MSEGYCRVLLFGALGRDPEIRGATLRINMVTNERYKDNSGSWQERSEWHDVVVLGQNRAESLARLLHKGDRVFVEGSLRTTQFEARDGQKRKKTEIVANSVMFAEPRRSGGSSPPPARPSPSDASEDFSGDYGPDPF